MAYGLLAPREPTHQPLTWLDNPKTIGLLSAALGILANNKGNYGAFGPAVGAGGLLGLQAALGTQQNNINNRRDERTDKRRDYFSREELDLRRKRFGLEEREFGLQEADIANENRAGGLIGNIIGGYGGGSGSGGGPGGNVAQILPQQPAPQGVPNYTTPQAVKLPYSDANLAQMQQVQQPAAVTVPTNEVEGDAAWKAVDAQLLQLDDLVKQDPAIARTKVYKDTRERLVKDRDFLSKQNEVKTLPGEPGVFYREGMGKPYEWVDDGSGGLKQRFISSKEINERGLKKAEAGASKAILTASLKGGESVLKEIGPMIKESRDEATGAVEQVDAAQRIKTALDAGGVIAGPTATLRLKGAQIASMLGVGGKDTAEAIANTRQAIRGLAEFTISVRKKLKGQGQVTEYEQKTLQKAYSGEIDDMTVEELKTVAGLTERLGRLMHKGHQTQLENMRNSEDPNIRGAVPFFSVPDLPPESPTKVRRYNPATGKIE